MPGLGRIPNEFKAFHVCGNCGDFAPLWNVDFAKWCDKCVREHGGIMKAGEIALARWREEHPLPERKPTPTVVTHAVPTRNAAQWQRAQSLHKAMQCTVEEAYDRLNAADEARKCTNTSA